ncbi:hypothetical protein GCM10023321_63630 [Pseudonocardia eucalypti]|uniref:Uncharacterized protein n=1 Tax=Pseudonocardia eucalypti TaxID=648755 RepID=A0ABP9QX49_9PSEU|nr:hypothetical protein [Pseudonocardia eucalypti]
MTDLALDVYTSPQREVAGGGWFSPTTSTILAGHTETMLVGAPYMPGDVDEIARRIDASGRALTTIYITHARLQPRRVAAVDRQHRQDRRAPSAGHDQDRAPTALRSAPGTTEKEVPRWPT